MCFYDEFFTRASWRSVEYFSFPIHVKKVNKGKGEKAPNIILSKHAEILGTRLTTCNIPLTQDDLNRW